MTLLRVAISLASDAVMGEMDVLLSSASRAPSSWLKSWRRHLMISASIAVSGLRSELSALLMLCSALPSTAWPLSAMNVCSHLRASERERDGVRGVSHGQSRRLEREEGGRT